MKKVTILWPFMFALFVSSCSFSSNADKALVNQLFIALNQHNLNGIASLYSDSAIIESPNLPSPEKGKKGIQSIYSRYFISSPDLKYEVIKIHSAESSITIEFNSSGTMNHIEGNGPIYMLNKKYTLKNCMILEIRAHKIIRDISYFDQVSFLRQVGFFDNH